MYPTETNQIALFPTAREVIKADNACREAGFKTRVISVPQQISSACGMCMEVADSDVSRFLELTHTLSLHVTLYNALNDTPHD